jgi:hypothetical protein
VLGLIEYDLGHNDGIFRHETCGFFLFCLEPFGIVRKIPFYGFVWFPNPAIIWLNDPTSTAKGIGVVCHHALLSGHTSTISVFSVTNNTNISSFPSIIRISDISIDKTSYKWKCSLS